MNKRYGSNITDGGRNAVDICIITSLYRGFSRVNSQCSGNMTDSGRNAVDICNIWGIFRVLFTFYACAHHLMHCQVMCTLGHNVMMLCYMVMSHRTLMMSFHDVIMTS